MLTAPQAAKVLALKRSSPTFTAMRRLAMRFRGILRSGDLDKLDLFFTPLDTFSFYKSLDLLVKGQLAAPPRPFQSEWDG